MRDISLLHKDTKKDYPLGLILPFHPVLRLCIKGVRLPLDSEDNVVACCCRCHCFRLWCYTAAPARCDLPRESAQLRGEDDGVGGFVGIEVGTWRWLPDGSLEGLSWWAMVRTEYSH